ncbi:MAG: 3-deoxy-7-phosphoheptulonate synthase [Candidatus Obscuribacterales bacterium]|nr:3-deoxy-7-phosphoheptulonate synthase [Candidatus Obscuribacterales bacterium]
MILVLRKTATEQQISAVCDGLKELNLTGHVVRNERGAVISVYEDVSSLPGHLFSRLPGVDKVLRLSPQLSMVTDERLGPVKLNSGVVIGGSRVVIAGPCSVEGRSALLQAARRVREAGADMLRGGAYKPRTSPYDFQGLGEDGLKILQEAREETGLAVISEVMSPDQIEVATRHIDVLQVGARNMYNYDLLKEIGRSGHPVLLKRALSATINEWLSAAEYVLLQGNSKVILCERGIRTFETLTRNTLDLSAVAAVKGLTALPVIVDPSHATGRPDLVRPLSRAAIACGADGLIIEVHDDPSSALSDGEQAINSSELQSIIEDVRAVEKLFPRVEKTHAAFPSESFAPSSEKLTVSGGCCKS